MAQIKGMKFIAAAMVLGMLGGCAGLSENRGGGSGETQTTRKKPVRIADAPQEDSDLGADTRFFRAVGCSSVARLVLSGSTPSALTEMGMPAGAAPSAATRFGAQAEGAGAMGETAARAAIKAGGELGQSESEVRAKLDSDYRRLVGSFGRVAGPQPEVAVSTINQRLRTCRGAFAG